MALDISSFLAAAVLSVVLLVVAQFSQDADKRALRAQKNFVRDKLLDIARANAAYGQLERVLDEAEEGEPSELSKLLTAVRESHQSELEHLRKLEEASYAHPSNGWQVGTVLATRIVGLLSAILALAKGLEIF